MNDCVHNWVIKTYPARDVLAECSKCDKVICRHEMEFIMNDYERMRPIVIRLKKKSEEIISKFGFK